MWRGVKFLGGNYASHFFFLKQSASQIQVDDSRQAELYFSISLCLHLNFQFILFDPKLQFGLIWVSQLSISLSIPTISYVFFFHQWTWSKQFKMKRFLAIDHIWIYLKFIFLNLLYPSLKLVKLIQLVPRVLVTFIIF